MNAPTEHKTCLNCRWWDTLTSAGAPPTKVPKYWHKESEETVIIGICRRYAPKGEKPWTIENDWCGEFSPGKEQNERPD